MENEDEQIKYLKDILSEMENYDQFLGYNYESRILSSKNLSNADF
jgi:hypothetical protein